LPHHLPHICHIICHRRPTQRGSLKLRVKVVRLCPLRVLCDVPGVSEAGVVIGVGGRAKLSTDVRPNRLAKSPVAIVT
jgi:hypothetical protein